MNHDDQRILDWHINENYVAYHGLATTISAMGKIPEWLFESDIRPAWEQLDERYVWGGWNPMAPGGFQLAEDDYLLYPGDEPMAPIAFAMLRDEKIILYPYSFVCIVSANGAFSIARLD